MEIHLEDAKRRAIGDIDNRVSHIDSLIVKLEEEIDGLVSHKEYLEKAKVGMQSLSPKEIWDKHPEFRR
jgi:prefoldin subunit 5